MSDLNSLRSVSLNRSISFYPLIQRLKKDRATGVQQERWGWTRVVSEGGFLRRISGIFQSNGFLLRLLTGFSLS